MRRFLNSMGCTLTLGLASACAPPPYHPQTTELDKDFKPAAQALDKLKWYVDAYGSASISTPMLVQPDPSFNFNLTTANADTFFDAAKNEISGRAAGVLQSAQVSGASLSVSVDVAAMQQYLGALSAFRQSQATATQQSQLLNQAALVQYQAAAASAQAIQDPTARSQALAAALTQLSQGLSSPAAAAPVIPAATAPAGAPNIPNAASALLPGFTAPQGLFATGTPSVSGQTRQALLLAAGDTATNAMLSLLGDAGKMSKFQGKRVLFGVSMVSVNPGWKTKESYTADLVVHLKYVPTLARPLVRDAFLKQKADPKTGSPVEQAALEQLQACVAASLPAKAPVDFSVPEGTPRPFLGAQFTPYLYSDLAHSSPLVAAVSPMADAQSLDLQSAARTRKDRALQIALQLSYVGLNAQAASFLDSARQFQSDLETRSTNVVVNAYSDASGTFGFRMYPSLEADPSHPNKDGGSRQLKPWSFPTLLIVGTDDADLRPRVWATTNAAGESQCFVVEPRLEVFETPHWTPNEELCRDHRNDDCVGQVLTEEERFSVASEVWNKVRTPMTPIAGNPAGGPRAKLATFMLQQAELLNSALNGGTSDLYLPVEYLAPVAATPKPSADTTAPSDVTLVVDEAGVAQTANVNMLIAGADLDQIDLTKLDVAAGKSLLVGAPAAKLVGKAILVTFNVNAPGAVVFKLPSKDASTIVYSAPLVVYKPRDFVVTTTTDKTKTGVVTDDVRYSAGTPIVVVKSHVERDKVHYPDERPQHKADVKLDIKAESKDR